MTLRPGDIAPEFSLADQDGRIRKLSDYKGKQVVLYFYPKDDTPGCTKEACSFRDNYSAYEQAGIEILGISPDSVKSHRKFKEKFALPFTLLSDPDHAICAQYGSWGRKKYMGKEYDGVLRTTYTIGADGEILRVFENVRPADHSAEVLSSFKA